MDALSLLQSALLPSTCGSSTFHPQRVMRDQRRFQHLSTRYPHRVEHLFEWLALLQFRQQSRQAAIDNPVRLVKSVFIAVVRIRHIALTFRVKITQLAHFIHRRPQANDVVVIGLIHDNDEIPLLQLVGRQLPGGAADLDAVVRGRPHGPRSGDLPTFQFPVPAESISMTSAKPASCTFLRNIHSAIGERQMLPRHTNRTFFFTINPPLRNEYIRRRKRVARADVERDEA